MASALETLCGQAYGAGQYQKLGIQTYTAILCLAIVCVPLSVLWINMGYILSFTGQDRSTHKLSFYEDFGIQINDTNITETYIGEK